MPPPFLLYLLSNYNQTWHDGTLGQNLLKATKILLTSSLGDKYDVIKPFLVSFQVKIRVPYQSLYGLKTYNFQKLQISI